MPFDDRFPRFGREGCQLRIEKAEQQVSALLKS
jgi:hypothetical protein